MRKNQVKQVCKKAIIVLLLLLCALSLFACKSEIERYDANVSELRTNLYAAESAAMKIIAITGRRENPFLLDGHSDAKQDFTVITIVPSPFSAGKTYGYKAIINGKTYEGNFLPHPFAESLSCDIPILCSENEIALTVLSDGMENAFTLVSQVTAETLSAEKALNIAMNKLSDSLKQLRSGNKMNAEIYIRLTENPIDNTGGYFWYVAFVGESQETFAVLLNSITGDVCAIRN